MIALFLSPVKSNNNEGLRGITNQLFCNVDLGRIRVRRSTYVRNVTYGISILNVQVST